MARIERALHMLAQDSRVISATRFAYQFGQDPVRVLADDTEARHLVRQAAMMILDRDRREEQARSKAKGRR